jgi:hypothetical protein
LLHAPGLRARQAKVAYGSVSSKLSTAQRGMTRRPSSPSILTVDPGRTCSCPTTTTLPCTLQRMVMPLEDIVVLADAHDAKAAEEAGAEAEGEVSGHSVSP